MGVGLHCSRPDQDRAPENRPRLPIENAPVVQAARRVGLCVVDVDVVVDVLRARRNVEAVQEAGAARPIQQNAEIVPANGGSPRERHRGERAVPSLVDAAGPHVESVRTLQEEPVVLDLRPISEDDLRHGVGEVTGGRNADVALDEGQLAVGRGHDEHPRVRGGGMGVACGQEDQVQRRRERFAFREMDESPVLEEGGVESGEPVVLEGGMPGEVLFDHVPVGADRLSQVRHASAVKRRGRCREARGVAAVDEDDARPAVVPGRDASYVGGAYF